MYNIFILTERHYKRTSVATINHGLKSCRSSDYNYALLTRITSTVSIKSHRDVCVPTVKQYTVGKAGLNSYANADRSRIGAKLD